MALQSRRINGNLVYYSSHRKNIIDAVGPDCIRFFEDFIVPVATADALVGWTTTLVEAGSGESTVTIPDASAGELLITTDANEDDGVELQKIGENFGMSTSQYGTYFGIRFKVSEATQSDFIVGLCITDTTLLGGMTDGCYFRKVDGSTSLAAVTEKNSTETETTGVHTVAADTYFILEFFFDGTSIEYFVNGTSVASHTTNICDDELLTPSMHFLAGSTVAKTMTVDWIRAIQVGR